MAFGAALLISYVARTVVLTLLLWIMVKLQKLDYFFLGLLGSAALASALDMIPLCGHYLAVPALYLCIWKVTGASLMPDAIFTVVVAYALMFAVRVFLLMAVLPPIEPLKSDVSIFVPQPARVAEVPVLMAAPKSNGPVPVAPPHKSADDRLKEVHVKGVTENGDNSAVLLSVGSNMYHLDMKDTVVVNLSDGPCKLRLKHVSSHWAIIEVDGEAAYLRLD